MSNFSLSRKTCQGKIGRVNGALLTCEVHLTMFGMMAKNETNPFRQSQFYKHKTTHSRGHPFRDVIVENIK